MSNFVICLLIASTVFGQDVRQAPLMRREARQEDVQVHRHHHQVGVASLASKLRSVLFPDGSLGVGNVLFAGHDQQKEVQQSQNTHPSRQSEASSPELLSEPAPVRRHVAPSRAPDAYLINSEASPVRSEAGALFTQDMHRNAYQGRSDPRPAPVERQLQESYAAEREAEDMHRNAYQGRSVPRPAPVERQLEESVYAPRQAYEAEREAEDMHRSAYQGRNDPRPAPVERQLEESVYAPRQAYAAEREAEDTQPVELVPRASDPASEDVQSVELQPTEDASRQTFSSEREAEEATFAPPSGLVDTEVYSPNEEYTQQVEDIPAARYVNTDSRIYMQPAQHPSMYQDNIYIATPASEPQEASYTAPVALDTSDYPLALEEDEEVQAASCNTCWACDQPKQATGQAESYYCLCSRAEKWAEPKPGTQSDPFCNQRACSQLKTPACAPFTNQVCACDASYRWNFDGVN
jgi:hypothetical protein